MLRSVGRIVFNVASSGIAALLLQGGRTAHSRFLIPVVVNKFTTCSIAAGSNIAELIKRTELIIWDEALMMSKDCFETLDRTMRDILKCDMPFGGKVVVFGGDFRQILPIVPDGGRAEIVLAALNSSVLWSHVKVLRLTRNMRLIPGDNSREMIELKSFSEWIMAIGDGSIGKNDNGESEIDIPEDLLVMDCGDPVKTIVTEIYGETFDKEDDPVFYQRRTILSPRHLDVAIINDYMLTRLSGRYFYICVLSVLLDFRLTSFKILFLIS